MRGPSGYPERSARSEETHIDPLHGIFWGGLGLLSWGFADYLARSVSVRIGSLSTAILVQVLGLALPLPFVIAELAANGLDADWGAVAIWAPLCGACLGAGYLCYYTGLQRGSVSVVSSAASAWLAVTVTVTVFVFGVHISLPQALLMGVVLAGILMLSAQPSTRSGGSTGLLWGVGAMFALGLALALLDRVTEASSPMVAVLIVRLLSIIPAYHLHPITRRGHPPASGMGRETPPARSGTAGRRRLRHLQPGYRRRPGARRRADRGGTPCGNGRARHRAAARASALAAVGRCRRHRGGSDCAERSRGIANPHQACPTAWGKVQSPPTSNQAEAVRCSFS